MKYLELSTAREFKTRMDTAIMKMQEGELAIGQAERAVETDPSAEAASNLTAAKQQRLLADIAIYRLKSDMADAVMQNTDMFANL